jgi:hypothetical protein
LWRIKKRCLVIIGHPEQRPPPMVMIGGGSGIGLNQNLYVPRTVNARGVPGVTHSREKELG